VKQYVRYYAALVALYIAVAHGTDAGPCSPPAPRAPPLHKSLQGRS
jgi:hypothetical protein